MDESRAKVNDALTTGAAVSVLGPRRVRCPCPQRLLSAGIWTPAAKVLLLLAALLLLGGQAFELGGHERPPRVR